MDDVAAKQEITEVIYRYCRGLDRMDRDLALSVWHADGTADYGAMYTGTGPGFVDWVWQAHAGFDRHSHQISNVLIEVTGDRATSESYVTVALWSRPDAEHVVEIIGRGRYVDRWSRRDGRWAVDHRQYIHDFQTIAELPATATDTSSASSRDRSDPSYAVLQG
jgi:hypothetical protein